MKTLVAYVAQRFPLTVFAPAVLAIAAGAVWSVESPTTASIVRALALTVVLVAQFRLWDDMEDADRDRVTHPERVLVHAPAGPFRALHAVLIAGVALISVTRPMALAAVLSLEASFLLAYRARRRYIPDGVWRRGVLLMKYPAFLVTVCLTAAPVVPTRLAAAAAAAYICAFGYEIWHQDRSAIGAS
jgi:hypothetical protein